MLLMSWISIILNCYTRTRSSNFDYPLESCTRENCIVLYRAIVLYCIVLYCIDCILQPCFTACLFATFNFFGK